MKPNTNLTRTGSKLSTRREFLKNSGTAVAGAALAGTLATPRAGFCAEDNAIKVALVGCGGRGTGAAANALSTKGPVKLWAMADVFEHRLEGSLKSLSAKHPAQMFVPPERRFVGFDGFRHAIDSLSRGDVVLLTTPPAFRPIHFDYAVQKGVNVFMEKSFAVDAPGFRRVLQAGDLAALGVQRVLRCARAAAAAADERDLDRVASGRMDDGDLGGREGGGGRGRPEEIPARKGHGRVLTMKSGVPLEKQSYD